MTGSTLQPFSPKINICLKICQLVKAGAFNSTTVRILPCTVSTHICLSKNLAAHFKVLQPYQVNYREQWVRTVEKLLRKKKSVVCYKIETSLSYKKKFMWGWNYNLLSKIHASNQIQVYKFEIKFFFESLHYTLKLNFY